MKCQGVLIPTQPVLLGIRSSVGTDLEILCLSFWLKFL